MITAFTIGRVIRSKDSNYSEGDIVLNPFSPIAEYCVVPSALHIRKVDPGSKVPLPDYISALGNSCSYDISPPKDSSFYTIKLSLIVPRGL